MTFSRLIVTAIDCSPSKPFSDFFLFCQSFLKRHHTSKTRVFEKRFLKLHCGICCLFTVKYSLSMSKKISFKNNFCRTGCYCLGISPFEEIVRFIPVLLWVLKYRHVSKTRVFEKLFSLLCFSMRCLLTVEEICQYERGKPFAKGVFPG